MSEHDNLVRIRQELTNLLEDTQQMVGDIKLLITGKIDTDVILTPEQVTEIREHTCEAFNEMKEHIDEIQKIIDEIHSELDITPP